MTCQLVGMEQLSEVLAGIQKTYPSDVYPLSALAGKFAGFMKSQMTAEEKLSALVKAATELTSQEAPKWENIAGNLLAFQFNSRLKKEEEDRKLWSLYDKIRYLTAEGLYGAFILENYSREEICEAESYIQPQRDLLFTFSGLELLIKRYVICTHQHVPLESVQEMFLGIAFILP